MPTPPRSPRAYTTHDPAIDSQIAALVATFGDQRDRQLISEMMTSAYRLGQDGSSTGDLKILNAALKELRYAFKMFKPYRHTRKVAMFGSARMSQSHPAYPVAQKFGTLMAEASWSVITGAASGIMKAGHEGAGRDASFGLNIRLPFEQAANDVIALDHKLVNCKYFFTRKLLFIKESHATALFPGGFGTLDEGFESLTLVQTGKSDPRPIVFVDQPDGQFWTPLLRFFERQLRDDGMISPSDCSIYRLCQSPEEAARFILRFYSTYHSLRYVGDRLVVRLQRPLPPGADVRLTREFRGLLRRDAIEQGGPLAGEADEPQLRLLPRLIFAFNRKEYGLLQQLIYRINELGGAGEEQPSRPRRRRRGTGKR